MKKNLQEKELVEKIIKKDKKAFYEFYQEYYPKIVKFINRQIKDSSQAEEIAQDTFIDFLEGLRDFRFQSTVKTFIFSIARNKTIDWLRKKRLKKILFSSLPSYIIEGLKVVFIDDEIKRNELSRRIKKVLQQLPNDYQMVLRLKYWEGEKVKTIAEKMAMSFKATESLIFRARKAFIKIFQNY